MFVQSARFVAEHKRNGDSEEGTRAAATEISIYGQEKTGETVKLCRMNLAIHGLEGDVREANTYYEDLHQSTGQFDFVLANPPFNVNAVDKERLTGDVGKNRRFSFGLPRTDNANYLWIQLFYSALNDRGRAGFIMANSASDARSSEQELRRQLISGAIMVRDDDKSVDTQSRHSTRATKSNDDHRDQSTVRPSSLFALCSSTLFDTPRESDRQRY
jgi:type I restriction enzyme M protein